MRYEIPETRRELLPQVVDRLRSARCAVLTTHLNADGDGVGSEVALAEWFRDQGSEAWIVNPTPVPDLYAFLLEGLEPHVLEVTSEAAARVFQVADLAVILDTGEYPRIGRVRGNLEGLDTVVVDHHQPGDQPIGGLSLRDPEASATGELVYDIVRATEGPWSPRILQGIYVAILTDTGSFRFSNATPAAHRIVAELIERGADPEDLHRRVYGASPLRALRLLEASLHTLEVDDEGGVAWMRVPRSAFEKLDADHGDLDGLVDYPRSVEGVEVGLLFRKTSAGDTKVSFRSNGDVDVNALAQRFGGGGHLKAAGALVHRKPEAVIPEVVEATRAAVRRLREGEDAS